MLLIPLKTKRIEPGDDLAIILAKTAGRFQPGDILVVSSKAVATAKGHLLKLAAKAPTASAEKFASVCARSPAFCQAVMDECIRLNGDIVGSCPGAILTELRPSGLTRGSILSANAGLDESNAPPGFAIGWPTNPVSSATELRRRLSTNTRHRNMLVDLFLRFFEAIPRSQRINESTKKRKNRNLAVIISDTCCHPRRLGVTAFALTVSGIDPARSEAGRPDLFGKPLTITTEAIADQLATAANVLMGNAAQSIPAVIIRNHGLTLSDAEGWVDGIEPEEDLFRDILRG